MSEQFPVVSDVPRPAAPPFEHSPRTSTPTTRALAVSIHTTMQSHHPSTDAQQSTACPPTTARTAAATTEGRA